MSLSSYEDYTRKSGNYDKTREPVGTEILVGCFAHAPVPLDRTVVLDAGCGTGSYSEALLGYVGRIEAVDMNPGMLEVAARKLAWAGDRVSFHSSRIDELPFDDATLDGVMINQVLHHLPDDPAEGFPAHRRVFREFARVLKPGGVLTVSTCSQEQLRTRLLALPPDPGGRRRPQKPLRPPRRAARDPRRLRPRPPGQPSRPSTPRSRATPTSTPGSPEQGVARR